MSPEAQSILDEQRKHAELIRVGLYWENRRRADRHCRALGLPTHAEIFAAKVRAVSARLKTAFDQFGIAFQGGRR